MGPARMIVSKSEKDARKVLGLGLAQHEVHTVVAGRSEFAAMTDSAKSAQEWLAKKVPEWNKRYLKSSSWGALEGCTRVSEGNQGGLCV